MRTLRKASVLPIVLFLCNKAMAQGIKVSSLSELESKAKEGTDSVVNIAKYGIGGVFAVALVFVIYSIATNQPHAKEYGVGWIVAFIFNLVATLALYHETNISFQQADKVLGSDIDASRAIRAVLRKRHNRHGVHGNPPDTDSLRRTRHDAVHASSVSTLREGAQSREPGLSEGT